jgi:hypothetical protein
LNRRCLFQHGHGLLGLGLEAHVRRHFGLRPTLGIVASLFGQIQPPVQEDGPFDADRAITLLDEVGLIHYADFSFIREDLNNVL